VPATKTPLALLQIRLNPIREPLDKPHQPTHWNPSSKSIFIHPREQTAPPREGAQQGRQPNHNQEANHSFTPPLNQARQGIPDLRLAKSEKNPGVHRGNRRSDAKVHPGKLESALVMQPPEHRVRPPHDHVRFAFHKKAALNCRAARC
jgi:hypothetical protein